jgi:hypothetical protein
LGRNIIATSARDAGRTTGDTLKVATRVDLSIGIEHPHGASGHGVVEDGPVAGHRGFDAYAAKDRNT